MRENHRRAILFVAVSLAACSGRSDVPAIVSPPATSLLRLVLAPDTANMKVGDTTRMAVSAVMSDGTVAPPSSVRLDSLYVDGTVARASVTGGTIQIVGVAPGGKALTAGVGNVTVSGMVLVAQPVLRIRVVPSSECLRKKV